MEFCCEEHDKCTDSAGQSHTNASTGGQYIQTPSVCTAHSTAMSLAGVFEERLVRPFHVLLLIAKVVAVRKGYTV